MSPVSRVTPIALSTRFFTLWFLVTTIRDLCSFIVNSVKVVERLGLPEIIWINGGVPTASATRAITRAAIPSIIPASHPILVSSPKRQKRWPSPGPQVITIGKNLASCVLAVNFPYCAAIPPASITPTRKCRAIAPHFFPPPSRAGTSTTGRNLSLPSRHDVAEQHPFAAVEAFERGLDDRPVLGAAGVEADPRQ